MSANLDNNTQAVAVKGSWWRAAGAVIGEPAWVLFSMFGLSLVVAVSVMKLFPPLLEASETTIGQLISNVAIYVLGVLFVLLPLIIKKRSGEITKLLGVDKLPAVSALGWASAAFAVYFWVTIIVGLLVSLVPGFDSDQVQDVGFSDVTSATEYIMAFVGLVILPPIFEEILFRGYLFGRLRRQVGFWGSAVVTSVIFGLVHGQWNVAIDTFVLSLFLCLLREYTGGLWAPILLHALKNCLAYFFLFIAPLIGLNLI